MFLVVASDVFRPLGRRTCPKLSSSSAKKNTCQFNCQSGLIKYRQYLSDMRHIVLDGSEKHYNAIKEHQRIFPFDRG